MTRTVILAAIERLTAECPVSMCIGDHGMLHVALSDLGTNPASHHGASQSWVPRVRIRTEAPGAISSTLAEVPCLSRNERRQVLHSLRLTAAAKIETLTLGSDSGVVLFSRIHTRHGTGTLLLEDGHVETA